MAIIRIARFWPSTRRASAAAAAVAVAETDGLEAFGSEEASGSPGGQKAVLVLAPAAPARPAASTAGSSLVGIFKWAAVILVSAGVTAAGMWLYQRRIAVPPVGRLTIETTPPGLEVAIGDQSKGVTPVTLDLAPGTYGVVVGKGDRRRVLNATVAAGTTLVERLEMTPAAVTGSLRVETDPPGLTVVVDGVEKGSAPVTVAELTPGDHQIVVAGATGPVRRNVSIRPDETVSLIVSAARPAAPAATAGWVAVSSRLPLQLREGGKVIGSTEAERVMLPAGDHALEFVNESLGFRVERRVSVTAGNTAKVSVPVPDGRLSINAQPWAEVWLNGERLGVTPIGNHQVPIGSHELVFRHPELGERRSTVSVGLQQPARVGIDMRKK